MLATSGVRVKAKLLKHAGSGEVDADGTADHNKGAMVWSMNRGCVAASPLHLRSTPVRQVSEFVRLRLEDLYLANA